MKNPMSTSAADTSPITIHAAKQHLFADDSLRAAARRLVHQPGLGGPLPRASAGTVSVPRSIARIWRR